MRLRILLCAAPLAALVLSATASGATGTLTLRGVTVAKDKAHRGLVVALQNGTVRTVRAPGAFGRVDVGRRVVIRYRTVAGRLPLALSVASRGRSAQALVHGTIVRIARGRAVVNAGGNALSISLRAVKRQRQLSSVASGPEPGDEVEVEVEIGQHGSLSAGTITAAPAASSPAQASEGELEVRGTVTALSPLTVKTGTGVLVSCVVPAGMTITGVALNDSIELKCELVGGQWTVRKAHSEDEGDDDGEHSGDHSGSAEVEATGTLTSLSPLTVTPSAGSPVICAIPAGITLTGFAVGQRVEVKCRTIDGSLTLVKLKVEETSDDNANDDDSGDGHDGNDDSSDGSGSGSGSSL